MPSKFYAVRNGKKIGIYDNWTECQMQISGFSGAEYKSFKTLQEAQAYINNDIQRLEESSKQSVTEAVAYVDGSYNSELKKYSFGAVLFYNGMEEHFSEIGVDENLAEMNNVAGEIKGAEFAMQFCLDHGIKSITIHHDYEGIAKWCTGEWKAQKDGTKAYKEFYDLASEKVSIKFVKVKGHSGDEYNELADQLAKDAFHNQQRGLGEKVMAKDKGIFIEKEKLMELISDIGQEKWDDFTASDLYTAGNAQRCNIHADGKDAMLNIYFKKDGSTTITPTGCNMEISRVIKALVEERCSFKNSSETKSYSIKNIPEEWAEKLIEYLKSLEDVTYEKKENNTVPVHCHHTFGSKIGDKLTVNVYQTGTLTLQGKPAYLYGEAISLLSYCDSVSVEDIVNTVNTFHDIDVKPADVRKELEALLPRSYGNIDDNILKLLSPSISLRHIKMELEDYSCYAFPALRALEGYIKYLFGLKNINIGYTFHGIFVGTSLTSNISSKIADATYQAELERLFAYFKGNRHVLFHTEQALIGTTFLEDKKEADEIINTVLNLIETSYTKVNGI